MTRRAPGSPREDRRSWLVPWLAAALLAAGLGCDNEPDVLRPGLGDFVQAVFPADRATLTANKFGEQPVTIVLNFFAAEGRFGFGTLQEFRFDGENVSDEVLLIPEGGPPPVQVTITFQAGEIDQGRHEVQVDYTDSRGTLHRIGWSFTIQG